MSPHHHRDRVTAHWTWEGRTYEITPANLVDRGVLVAIGPSGAIRTVVISLDQAEEMTWITWDDTTRTLMAERWFKGELSLPS